MEVVGEANMGFQPEHEDSDDPFESCSSSEDEDLAIYFFFRRKSIIPGINVYMDMSGCDSDDSSVSPPPL